MSEIGDAAGELILDTIVTGLDEENVTGERQARILTRLLNRMAQQGWRPDETTRDAYTEQSHPWVIEAMRRSEEVLDAIGIPSVGTGTGSTGNVLSERSLEGIAGQGTPGRRRSSQRPDPRQ